MITIAAVILQIVEYWFWCNLALGSLLFVCSTILILKGKTTLTEIKEFLKRDKKNKIKEKN